MVYCTEVEDSEQKKRGVGKANSFNSLTTGAQKQDYTYSIYSSNPNSQSTSSSTYESQPPNSFYPSQTANQYYSSQNTQSDTPSYSQQQQPQINLLPPSPTSQFAPLNFVPNSGYHAKYQIIPSKSNGNIQLAIYQQPANYPGHQIVPYSPHYFSPNPNQMNSHHGYNIPQPQGQFHITPNYQQALGGSYLGQPSTMLFFAQPNLNQLYNNLAYPNPVQSFYNYYPSNTQSKYSVPYISQGFSADYEKLQGPVSHNTPKDDNDIGHSNEYTVPSDSSSNYKNAYSANRNSYSKV